MVDFISSLPDFNNDEASKQIWRTVQQDLIDVHGVCYYRHPVLGTAAGVESDLTLFTVAYNPAAIRCIPYGVDEIDQIKTDYWIANGEEIDSPVLELEDFVYALNGIISQDRLLRRRLSALGILAMPFISADEWGAKFGSLDSDFKILWRNDLLSPKLNLLEPILQDDEWLSFRALVQSATPLRVVSKRGMQSSNSTLSGAIRKLDRQIKVLDDDQEKVAIQIPPGPQRIRGLAGTGKTVLLAMKAANIHRHFPEKRILFTFHTRTLYNQTKRLIERFYGFHRNNLEPDWNRIHIRHAWGSWNRAGVYSDICDKQGVWPLDFRTARSERYSNPFEACCKHALELRIEPFYDYVLVDEAQDFPPQFFEVLYRLTRSAKDDMRQIYWAYDELQSLASNSLAIPGPETLFGTDQHGNAFVQFDGQDYAGGIPKDLVLSKSYRCPHDVLMLAHAIGLGLYSAEGCIQMLENKESWSAIGYEIDRDIELEEGVAVSVHRPEENSPNRIKEYYTGQQSLIRTLSFDNRADEFDWIARSICDDVKVEGVAPENIVVIVLDAKRIKEFAADIQVKLQKLEVASTIPGVIHNADAYAESGRVTISSVFRAKGNEAYVVYVAGFEELYSYVHSIENRNRAFTAISRSMGWVRITGTGPKMGQAYSEIDAILNDIPKLNFTFPNMQRIRNLDAVTRKRQLQRSRGDTTIRQLTKDPDLIRAASPELLEELRELLQNYGDDHQ